MHCWICGSNTNFKPIVFYKNINVGLQQLWSDVVFVRDFTRLDVLTERQLITYIIIMYELYKAVDLTVHIIDELGKLIGKPLRESYMGWLASK